MIMHIDDEKFSEKLTKKPAEKPETVSRLAALLCNYGLHLWTKWRVYDQLTIVQTVKLQERRCLCCGKQEQTGVFYSLRPMREQAR